LSALFLFRLFLWQNSPLKNRRPFTMSGRRNTKKRKGREMTDENAKTADLTPDEKLDQVLAKLTNLDTRLAALEARADDRAGDTRPLLNHLIQEMTQTRDTLTERIDSVEKALNRIEKQLKTLTQDAMQVRTDQQSLEDRIDAIERRPN
jgi:chromosome segregation ATPase